MPRKCNTKAVPVIAAIGASITEGAGANDMLTESYPAQLQGLLGSKYTVFNFGKSGRTVRRGLPSYDSDPLPWIENRQWTETKAAVPDVAIINMGTNDSRTTHVPATTVENFKQAYEYLLDELLKVNPDMRIIVCTVPYTWENNLDISNDNIRNIIAPVIRGIAKERGLELVDLFEITENKSRLFCDGVHLTTRGYEMLAKVFEKVILVGAKDALTAEFLAEIDEGYSDKSAPK